MVELLYTKTEEYAKEPRKANPDDAGFDLTSIETETIWSGHTKLISTGIKMAIPEGYVGFVCSRSGLAAKHDVFVLNSPGVIDAGYRGEVKIILHNAGEESFKVNIGDRIAQLVLVRLADIEPKWIEDTVFEKLKTNRGEGGFGSTGVKS